MGHRIAGDMNWVETETGCELVSDSGKPEIITIDGNSASSTWTGEGWEEGSESNTWPIYMTRSFEKVN